MNNIYYLGAPLVAAKAFDNWMERDALFAISALGQARELDYTALIVDGTRSVQENLLFAEETFNLVI